MSLRASHWRSFGFLSLHSAKKSRSSRTSATRMSSRSSSTSIGLMGLKSLNLPEKLFHHTFVFQNAMHTPRARRTWVLVVEVGGWDEGGNELEPATSSAVTT